MKTFKEHTIEDEYIEEGAVRSTSALVLFNRIISHSRTVHRTKDVEKKLDAIASQNTNLAALMYAMTQFEKNQK